VPGLLPGLAAALFLMVAGEADDLPRAGEEAGVEIEGGDAEFSVFDAPVGTLDVRGPGGVEVVELLLGQRVKGGLVVLEGEIEVGSGGGDG